MGNVLLSGALLGLPHSVGSLLQPFTTAFYAWAGSVSDMAHTEVFPAIQVLNTSQFPTTTTAAALLSLHMLVGLACALWAITAKSARRE